MTDGPLAPTPPAAADRWARRRRFLIPALIALTSLLGSVGAWRAAAASGAAGAAERKAFADTVAAEQQLAAIETVVGSIKVAYTRRVALQEAAATVRAQAAEATASEASQLLDLAYAYEATAAAVMVDPDALAADGSLDLEAKRQVEWALAANLQDLDPQPEMAEAERLRAKSERLVGLTAALIGAALFLTLAQVSRRPRAVSLYWAGGLGVLAVGAVLLLVVEVL